MNNNNTSTSNNKSQAKSNPKHTSLSLPSTQLVLGAHNESSSIKQLPLKTIFLNKYEQLKNPTSSSSNSINEPSTSNNNNNTALIVDNTNTNTTLGALLLDPSQHQILGSSGPHHLNPDLSGIAETSANFELLHSQYDQPESQPYHQQSNSSSSSKKTSTKMPSTSSKSTLPAPAPSTSSGGGGGGGGDSSNAMKRHFSGSNSSLQNSDDDDDYDEAGAVLTPYLDPSSLNYSNRSKEEKRRLSHTAAEQKRRNAIKQGYELLQNVVPSCQQTDPIISTRITRATTLEQTIDYIHELQKEKDKHDQELDSLKKEITALKIMRQNYDEMLQYHRNQPKNSPVEVNDEAKFELFVKYSDNLFHSFQSTINPTSFSDLSCSLFNWLEQAFSANNLKSLAYLTLVQAAQQIFR